VAQFTSLNFEFLKAHDRQLVQLGASAERYFSEDPNTCLIKLRQFGELLAQLVAVEGGIQGESNQQELLRLLGDRRIIGGDVEMAFHELRKVGNQAVHHLIGNQRQALQSLKYAHFLGSWFYRSFGDSSYKRRAFVPPTPPVDSSITLQQELAALQTEMRKSLTQAELVTAKIAIETQWRIQAEELTAQAEADRKTLEAHIAELQTKLLQTTKPIQGAIDQAQKTFQSMQLNEAETRYLIDAKLREAGWDADSVNLTYGNGVRPTKGKNLAIAEYPVTGGRADYVLFVGLQAVGAIEAKKSIKNVYGAIDQAKRYSDGFTLKGEDKLVAGAPWKNAQLPFVFSTNGKSYLQQLEHQSGIWFCDLRRSQNLRRAIGGWYTPEGLMDLLNQDIDQANTQLEIENFHYGFELRPYQITAIRSVERALADDRRNLLLAMATGTGKTKTCIALVYRLLKTKRFRRVLFLVDRTALGEQATGAFKETRMESLQTFADIFDIKELKDAKPDRDTKVQIATVQSFVSRLLYPRDDKPKPTVDQYDCIVVDECH
jgi:type I restriction enzyme R subunit